MNAWRLVARTKLYWGLAAIFAAGVLFSPVSSKGTNIFLTYGNLADVLRQVSITGIVAVGMTLVILTAGIDLSVGSVLAFGSVACAHAADAAGLDAGRGHGRAGYGRGRVRRGVPALRFIARALAQGPPTRVGARAEHRSRPLAELWLPAGVAAAVALAVAAWTAGQVPGKLRRARRPARRSLPRPSPGCAERDHHRPRPAPALHRHAGDDGGSLGAARLTAGQDNAVLPVYTGSNAVEEFDALRSVLFGVLPVPGLFFLGVLVLFALLLNATVFGRYVYAIGGNEEATRLSGVPVGRVKIAAYALSGCLAALAGVLYAAQYRQGKPDAGTGLELDAIAAVAIGGTSLMGGKGGLAGTFVGVLIFGLLGNILQLNNITANLQLLLKGIIIVFAVLLAGARVPRPPDPISPGGRHHENHNRGDRT